MGGGLTQMEGGGRKNKRGGLVGVPMLSIEQREERDYSDATLRPPSLQPSATTPVTLRKGLKMAIGRELLLDYTRCVQHKLFYTPLLDWRFDIFSATANLRKVL